MSPTTSVRPLARAVMLALAGVTAAAVPAKAQARTLGTALTLRQVLDSVARRHPLVDAARARVRAARGARTTAGALGNPMLAYQVQGRQTQGGQTAVMEREAMTTATLPLEQLYQRGSRVRRANADLRAAEADATVELRRVALDAARAYYRTALAQVGLEAARDLASWLDTVVTYNRTRANEGVAAEADLIRTELERDRAVADATMQEADLVRTRLQLATFLGYASAASTATTVAIDNAPLALPGDAFRPLMLERALMARPELRAGRERLASANAGVTVERTMLVRQFGATVGTMQTGGATSLIAGFSVPLPLFDQNRGEVARAAGEREAVAFELASRERVVRAEVAAAYEVARLLTERAGALSARSHGYLARADEARRIALGAYREGAVPLIQVIDAARAWGEARLAYYRTLYAQHESVLELVAAQGGDIVAVLPSLTR